jgi:hypothetical protein
MKTITVISDSHGNRASIDRLMPIFAESDYIIHLGDTSGDGNYIKKTFPEKTVVLNGNCDIVKVGESQVVLTIEGVKIFACHGDAYGVKRGIDNLAYKAQEEGCTVALYGHTHRAQEDELGGVKIFNPGNLSRYSKNSYLYLVINGDKATGKIVECTQN